MEQAPTIELILMWSCGFVLWKGVTKGKGTVICHILYYCISIKERRGADQHSA